MKDDYFILSNGEKIPNIIAGTYPLKGYTMLKTVKNAIKSGYKGFDSASAYGNERWLGLAKILMPIKSKNIFITTKFNLFDENINIEEEVNGSLRRLNLKYIDLYLMHWPHPKNYIQAWKQMESVYKKGLVKAIGVCNFEQRHLEKLLEYCEIKPMVNQIEIHPLLTQKDLIKFCNYEGIQVEAYCPFGQMNEKIKKEKILIDIANRYKKSISQIILKWHLENGIIPIPRTSDEKKLKENIDIFDFNLTKSEIELIDSLNMDYKVYEPEKYCPGY